MRVIRGCLGTARGNESFFHGRNRGLIGNRLIAVILALVMSCAIPGIVIAADPGTGFGKYDLSGKETKTASDIGIRPEIIDPFKRLEKASFANYSGGTKRNAAGRISRVGDSGSGKGSNHSGYASMLSGYPMFEMVGSLEDEAPEVAAFLIAIAKKESNWGNHAPKRQGKECYNYWGFKGGPELTDSGYGCFDSPSQAVSIVGNRIAELIGKNVDTPERMVVWKCGSDCRGHDQASVRKWVSDVSAYYDMASS